MTTEEKKFEKFEEFMKKYEGSDFVEITIKEEKDQVPQARIKFKPEATVEQCNEFQKALYAHENQSEENINVFLNLKDTSFDVRVAALKFAMSDFSCKDPITLLNILNIIKISNNLDSAFFEDENIWLLKSSEMINVRMSLKSEINAFRKELARMFFSLFISYNKTSYSPRDEHIALPNTFQALFLTNDIQTISGIVSVAPTFDTKECVFIEQAIFYITHILRKNIISMDLMNSFLDSLPQEEEENKSEESDGGSKGL